VLGRDAELARVDLLLERAARGHADVCVVVGEPGFGKTALCRAAVERAGELGPPEVTVLLARGVEDEAVFAYSVLADLMRPLDDLLTQLPERERDVLNGIIGRSAAPITEPSGVGAALLVAFAVASDHQPLLIVVDDAHWSDQVSLEALAFALRRLRADPVATVVTSRPPVPHALGGFPSTIELRGLDQASALALMEAVVPNIAPSVARRLAAEAAGNPLVLTELPTLLTSDQLSGRVELPDPLPIGPHTALSFARPMRGLPDRTRDALAVLALTGSADRLLAPAYEALGLELADLIPAEEARLVALGSGAISFRHPVVRTTAVELVSPARRREIHAALAVAAEALDPERYPWELDLANVGRSEAVATAFEAAATAIASRRGLAAVAKMLTRAAAVGERPERRSDRLLAAAQASIIAGDLPGCMDRLDELDATVEVAPPAAVLLRAQAGFWGEVPPDHPPRLMDAADRVALVEPNTAARILALVGLFGIRSGNIDAVRRARTRMAALVPRLDTSTLATVAATSAFLDLLTDDWTTALASMHDEQLWTVLRASDPLTASDLAYGLVMAGQPEVAVQRASQLIGDLREVNAVTRLPYLLSVEGQAWHLLGQWSRAEAALGESSELGEHTRQPVLVANAQAYIAVIAAGRGSRPRCFQVADQAERLLQSVSHAAVAVPLYLHHARGLCALGDGQVDEACHHLLRALAVQRSLPAEIPTFSRFAGDLLEALSAGGRRDDAVDVLTDLENARAARWSQWIEAIAHRGHGLVDEDDQAARFEAALIAHPPWDSWETARTQLCFARHLRRGKQRRAASEQLRGALATFERLGAEAWALQARQELRAAGVDVHHKMRQPAQLTPQELRVALAVAAGGTNREIAASLFLSTKTVEHHLGRAYAKLGVTSRTQLARAVAVGQLDALTVGGPL
jgi:DNA-binding CsgD family transcriptional regulator